MKKSISSAKGGGLVGQLVPVWEGVQEFASSSNSGRKKVISLIPKAFLAVGRDLSKKQRKGVLLKRCLVV